MRITLWQKNVVNTALINPEKYFSFVAHQTWNLEKNSKDIIRNVTTNFLGNHKAENYQDMAADLVQSYKAMACNMSLKMHLLDSHFDLLP